MRRKIAFIVCIGLFACSMSGWADAGGGISENGSESVQESADSLFGRCIDEDTDRENAEIDKAVSMDALDPEDQMSEDPNQEDVAVDETTVSIDALNPEDQISGNLSDNEEKDDRDEGISSNENKEIKDVLVDEEDEQGSGEDTESGGTIAVSTNDTEKGGEAVSLNKIKQQAKEKGVTKVSMPANVQIHFDPADLNGKGGIFSEKYQVANYGDQDVVLKIKKMDISYGSENEQYEMISDNNIDSYSKKKIMNINIVWDNKNENIKKVLHVREGEVDECVIYLKAAKYDEDGRFEGLNEGSKGEFYFTGALNQNPDIQWYDGEIAVNYRYDIINVTDEETRKEADRFISENSWDPQADLS